MKNLLRYPYIRKILSILAGAALVIILLNYLIMPWYVHSAETKVPGVIGMKDTEAMNVLEQAGFKPMISDTSFGLDFAAGTIFLQKPDAGKLVKEGRTVYLFISGGEKVVLVPMLTGKSLL
jgi:serine/threonine-protein kinase